jgi:hypothetical protein
VDPELEVNVSTVHQDEDGRLMEDPPVKRKVPCAVLKCQAAIRVKPPEGLPLTLEFTGTLHYSLEHRLIVQFDLEGKLHVKGSLRDYSFDHSGDYRDEMLLRFHRLAPAEDRPSGEEPKNG